MRESKKDSKERKRHLAILGPILKDLGLARRRIRKLGTARWLFDFAYSDLDTLSAGEITNFVFDSLSLVISKDPKAMDDQELPYAVLIVDKFVGFKIVGNIRLESDRISSPPSQGGSILSSLKKIAAGPLELLSKPSPTGPTEWLFVFHDELRKEFDGFFTGHYWKHMEPATMKFLLCPGVPPYDDRLKLDSDDPPSHARLDPVGQLMLMAGRAVFAEKEKFGVCERCKKPFIAEKNPLRKFCSATCAQYVRTTRYRQKQRGS
jgi:hypothetical protein